jgi:hypothetical protein
MPTFKELHQQIAPEIKLRAWQIRVKNLTGAYDGNRNATEQEIRALSLPAVKRTTTVRTRNGAVHQQRAYLSGIHDNLQRLEPKADPIAAVPTCQPPVVEPAPEPIPAEQQPASNWQLWTVLIFSLGCSVPNMYSVALQMKDTPELAAAITLTFTIAPLLLLISNSRTARMAAFIPIGVEVFANAVGYFGGLLRISVGSDEIRPGKFLHLVANMFGTDYRPTALFLAILFAASIAALSIISAHNIKQQA